MFVIIKNIFVVLLASRVNTSNHTKYVLPLKQKCKIQPTLINYILINTAINFATLHLRLN